MGEADGNTQVDAVAARTFAADFLPDPKLAATMAEPDVLAYHGRIKEKIDASVAAAVKERGDFSPEWRQAIAGDNPDALTTLNRFQTPKALWESYAALRGKVSSGELKAISPFPAAGTPEQQAQWRADAGLPTKPEDYKVEPPAGVVIGEEDKPFIDGFLKFAHGKNMTPEAVNTAVAWWGEQRKERMEKAAAETARMTQETEDKLRADWGPEYRPSMARIEGLLATNLPNAKETTDSIMAAVKVNPDFANFLAKVAFQLNPAGLPMPAGEEGQIKSVEDWLSKADKMMRTDRVEYNKTMANDYQKYLSAYQAQTGKEWGRK